MTKNNFIYLNLRTVFHKIILIPKKLEIIYEKKLSILIFYLLRPVIFIFEKILEMKNIILIYNISDGAGHLLEETDYLYKLNIKNKKVFKDKKVFWITKKTNLFSEFKKEFEKDFKFINIILSKKIFYLMLPILFTNNKKITFDCGLGQQSYNLNDQKINFNYNSILQTGIRMKYKETYLKKSIQIKNNYNSKYKSFINKNYSKKEISEFFYKLGIKKSKKIVLVQLNNRKINQSAKPTQAKEFEILFKYLKKKNYQIILIGREKMPKIFKKYNVIDYANSKFSSFINDIKIFHISDFSIISASGLYFIPYFLRKKFLYINGWGFSENLGHYNSLQWPALIKSKNGFLKLSKQKKIYVDSFNLNHSVIPLKNTIKNITKNELVQSFKELENSRKKKKFRKYHKLFMSVSGNNFPDLFLKKYNNLIND